MVELDSYVIQVGKKYCRRRLDSINLVDLDEYLGIMESWDKKYQTVRVMSTIDAIRRYLKDPVIVAELERSFELNI